MFELLVVLGVVFAAGAVILLALKLLFALLILPFKAALFLAKGVIGLVIAIPLVILFSSAFTVALPFLLLFLVLPVLAGIGLIVALFKLVF